VLNTEGRSRRPSREPPISCNFFCPEDVKIRAVFVSRRLMAWDLWDGLLELRENKLLAERKKDNFCENWVQSRCRLCRKIPLNNIPF
jgi:hypothetical protein